MWRPRRRPTRRVGGRSGRRGCWGRRTASGSVLRTARHRRSTCETNSSTSSGLICTSRTPASVWCAFCRLLLSHAAVPTRRRRRLVGGEDGMAAYAESWLPHGDSGGRALAAGLGRSCRRVGRPGRGARQSRRCSCLAPPALRAERKPHGTARSYARGVCRTAAPRPLDGDGIRRRRAAAASLRQRAARRSARHCVAADRKAMVSFGSLALLRLPPRQHQKEQRRPALLLSCERLGRAWRTWLA